MYSMFGVCLIERGWPAAIPLMPCEKRPSISGWQKYNTSVVSLEQAKRWARQFPNHGIGHAAGHGLVGIDLDTDLEKQAGTARDIADQHLGPTPMIRVGRAPRVMRYYRLKDDGSNCIRSSSSHLFGIYATKGQTAWFGIHPKTGNPYDWIDASPLDMGPEDLPAIAGSALKSFAKDMIEAFPAPMGNRQQPQEEFLTGGGMATPIMSEMALSPNTPPLDIALKWIASATVGTRHYTMVGAVTALVHAGLGDREIFYAVVEAHINSVAGDRPDEQITRVVKNAVAWARNQIGASLDSLDKDLHVGNWSIWQ